ncbi:hypothetical protein [Burkholderia sp. IMCC1007]|uniref:hypothetical protein n=1 Tax=Burkholderia sp. IMCC1007 TaxID=3004104 RepID=UPI0022B3F7C4|nr:hypothetical protein [Burkholderia sp. IMCC1007]
MGGEAAHRRFADLGYDRIILPAYFFVIGSSVNEQGPGAEALKRRPGPMAKQRTGAGAEAPPPVAEGRRRRCPDGLE